MKRSPRHQQLARIHIAQRELGIADVAYRDLLQRVAGVRSSANTDTAGRNAVIAELARVRMKRERMAIARAPGAVSRSSARAALAPLQAALDVGGRNWTDAAQLARRRFRTRLEWLRPDQVAWLARALTAGGR